MNLLFLIMWNVTNPQSDKFWVLLEGLSSPCKIFGVLIVGTTAIATLLIQSNSFESKKKGYILLKLDLMEEGGGNKVIAAYNIFKGVQVEIGLAEIYLGIHNAMNSFSLTHSTSTAGRKTSYVRLDNNILWIIIAAIHRERFSIDCYHFESLYLILIWVAALRKSWVDWKIGLFYQSVWVKEGLPLFTVTSRVYTGRMLCNNINIKISLFLEG